LPLVCSIISSPWILKCKTIMLAYDIILAINIHDTLRPSSIYLRPCPNTTHDNKYHKWCSTYLVHKWHNHLHDMTKMTIFMSFWSFHVKWPWAGHSIGCLCIMWNGRIFVLGLFTSNAWIKRFSIITQFLKMTYLFAPYRYLYFPCQCSLL